MNIDEARKEIDAIDASIVKLLDRRAKIVFGIGAVKARAGLPVFDRRRESEVMRNVNRESDGSFGTEPLERRLLLALTPQRTAGETIEPWVSVPMPKATARPRNTNPNARCTASAAWWISPKSRPDRRRTPPPRSARSLARPVPSPIVDGLDPEIAARVGPRLAPGKLEERGGLNRALEVQMKFRHTDHRCSPWRRSSPGRCRRHRAAPPARPG